MKNNTRRIAGAVLAFCITAGTMPAMNYRTVFPTAYAAEEEGTYVEKDGMFYIEYADHIAMIYCEPDGDTLAFPDTVDGKPVTAIISNVRIEDYTSDNYDLADIPEFPDSVKKVFIPEGVEEIGDDVFFCTDGYSGLNELYLPSTLKKVGGYAFLGCNNLNVYGLPENVELGNDAFENTSFDAEKNVNLIINDEMVYLAYPDHIEMVYCAPDGDTIAFPDMVDGKPVTKIVSDYAIRNETSCFFDSEDIPELTVDVKKINIPEGVEEIGDDVFFCIDGYSGLNELYLPSTLKKVGGYAFLRCNNLNVYGLPENVELGNHAFDDTSFDAEKNVNLIINDEMVYLAYPDHIEMLYCAPDGDTIAFPDTVDGKPVTKIVSGDAIINETSCFFDSEDIPELTVDVKKIYIPEGVEEIGEDVFLCYDYSNGLDESLRELYLPSTLKKVGEYAFVSCNNLNVYGLPENVELGDHAFDNTSFDAEKNVNLIINDEMVYLAYPDHIEMVYCAPDGDTIAFPDMVDGKPVTKIISSSSINYIINCRYYEEEIPHLTKDIKKVYIPEGVEEIGEDVFLCYDDSNGLDESLRELYLPSTLKKVGNLAFEYHRNLNVYGMPENTEIDGDAFYATRFDAERRANCIINDEMEYVEYSDHIEMSYIVPDGDTMTFPDTVNGKPVTVIDTCVVEDFADIDIEYREVPDSVKKVYIPEGVEAVGGFTNYDRREGLYEVYLPSTLKRLCAFRDNTKLNVYGLPETAEIEDGVLDNTRYDVYYHSNFVVKDGMVYYEYPDHIVFCNCEPDGDTIVFPDMVNGKPVTVIDTLSGREYGIIPDSVKKVYIPEGVELVEGFVNYDGREGLSEVHFPSTLKMVYRIAFEGNKNLKIFDLPETAVVMEDAFNGTPYEGKFTTAAYGDVNLDGKVTLADSLAILQFIANEDKYPLSAEAQKNADCYNPGDGITGNDAVAVMRYDTNVVVELPIFEK